MANVSIQTRPNARGHHLAVLTPEKVIELRQEFADLKDRSWSGVRKFSETQAAKVGVTPKTITDVINGTTWRHLKTKMTPSAKARVTVDSTNDGGTVIAPMVAAAMPIVDAELDAIEGQEPFSTGMMDTDEFITKFKTHPRQRDTERHARSAVKNHLAKPSIAQQVVSAASFNGEMYKLDGHTRSHLWATGGLPKPARVHVTIYNCSTEQELMGLYDTFDNRTAAESTSDLISGYLRKLDINLQSQMMRNYKFGSALRAAHEIRFGIGGGSPYSVEEALQFYREELLMIDSINPLAKVFKIGVMAGALIVLKRRGRDMLPFFQLVNSSGGVKADGQCDGVQALNEIILRNPSANYTAAREMVARTISCAETWRAKRMYAVTPYGVKVKPTDYRAYARRDA